MSNKLAKSKNSGGNNIISERVAKVSMWAMAVSILALVVSFASFMYMRSYLKGISDAIAEGGASEGTGGNQIAGELGLLTSGESSLEKGDVYNGYFAEDLALLGITLNEITNLDEAIGASYDGSIYTYESDWFDCTRIDGNIKVGGDTFSIEKASSFDALLEKGYVVEEENGASYYKLKDEAGEDACIVYASEDVAMNYDGGERQVYVGYVYFKDIEFCKTMGEQIRVGDIGIGSSIADTVSYFGTPTYVDVYEGNGQDPYVMVYYSYLNSDDNTMDEATFVFVKDESDEKGYVLSEITMSIF